MSTTQTARLRFNFGFLLEAPVGTSRSFEIDYPDVRAGEDVYLAPFTGSFTVTRTSEGVFLQGQFHSTMPVACVRCTDEFVTPIQIDVDELFYYPAHLAEEGDMTFDSDTGFIDLGPLVRDLSILSVPVQTICRDGNCAGLCDQCGQNLNEGDCDCEKESIDPRLAILKTLLNNNDI